MTQEQKAKCYAEGCATQPTKTCKTCGKPSCDKHLDQKGVCTMCGLRDIFKNARTIHIG